MIRRGLASLTLLAACAGPSDPGEPLPPGGPRPPWGVPISGGTMRISHDGRRAIIADPDRDRIVSVDLASGASQELTLEAGDEPGRVVEDGAGRIHVALRRGGAVITLAADLAMIDRQPVCAEPRGLAWDAGQDAIDVACAGGELVTLPAAGGPPTRRLGLDRDLRDVVVTADGLKVSRFRSAELLSLDAGGAISGREVSPTFSRFRFDNGGGPAVPEVAWRTIVAPDGRVVMLHQRQVQAPLGDQPRGGWNDCGAAAEPALTIFRTGAPPQAVWPGFPGALPVDVAFSPAGDRLAVVSAGSGKVHELPIAQLAQLDEDGQCGPERDSFAGDAVIDDHLGAPTSADYTPEGTLVIFYPELPGIVVHGEDGLPRTIDLPGGIGYDAGRALFHRQTASGLACASCHPEGREDGRVWTFEDVGQRRTQSLAGHLSLRAPYHWDGGERDLPTLMDDIFTVRMGGRDVTDGERRALGPWLDRVPPPAPVVTDADAALRGRALFESVEVGCATCHVGPLFTDNRLFPVGTDDTSGFGFKVPSLIGVGARPPYLHDGCAATLLDRFGPCGGGDAHGRTSQLTAAQLDDLVAYLDSL